MPPHGSIPVAEEEAYAALMLMKCVPPRGPEMAGPPPPAPYMAPPYQVYPGSLPPPPHHTYAPHPAMYYPGAPYYMRPYPGAQPWVVAMPHPEMDSETSPEMLRRVPAPGGVPGGDDMYHQQAVPHVEGSSCSSSTVSSSTTTAPSWRGYPQTNSSGQYGESVSPTPDHSLMEAPMSPLDDSGATVVSRTSSTASLEAAHGTKAAGGAARKESGRIKRPMNSFMVFGKKHRHAIQKSLPSKDNKAVSKVLGSMWAALSPQEKQVYVDEANRLVEQHKKDYPDWKFKRNVNKKKAVDKVKASKKMPAEESVEEKNL